MKRSLAILMIIVMCAMISYAAPVMTSGFEKGTDSDMWTFNGTSFDLVTPLTGRRSLRINPNMTQQYAVTKNQFGMGILVARTRVRFNTLPNTQIWIIGNGSAGALYQDGMIYAASASGKGTGVAVQTGVIYTIDVRVNMSVTPWLIDAQVNGVPCGQFQQPSPIFAQPRNLYLGGFILLSADMVFDDVALSVTASDYPLGF